MNKLLAPMPRFREVEGREYITERRTGPADRREHAEVRYSLENVLRERDALQVRLDFWKRSAQLLMRLIWLGVIGAAIWEIVKW
jgi:hypothetical protein